VVDQTNNRIQKFTNTGAFLGKWGSSGSGDGQFNTPYDIATDGAGNVFVSDNGNRIIQKFSGSGAFLAKWGSSGTGDGQFNTPVGIGTDADGNVYVSDDQNSRIQKFKSDGTFLTKWGTNGSADGQFNLPLDVAADAAGHVYVADNSNSRVQEFTRTGTFLAKWGSSGSGDGQFGGLLGIGTDLEGNIYVSDNSNARIQKFSAAGAPISEATGSFLLKWGSSGSGSGQFNNPVAAAVDASGNLFVAEYGNHRIQKFSSTGTFITQWGSLGSGNSQFNQPQGIAVDASGNVYVADTQNHRIQKFSNAGLYTTQWGGLGSGNGQLNQPVGLAIDPAGNVYVGEFGNNRIQEFTSSGTYVRQWGAAGSGNSQFNGPVGIAIDPAGSVYVTEQFNHRVQVFTSAGAYVTQWGSNGSGNGQFNQPYGIAVDPAGRVVVADRQNHRVQKFTSWGTYLTQWGTNGSSNGQFNQPIGLATDASGNLFVTEYAGQRVQKFVTPASIALVSDVGNDQGGQTMLRVLRSSADAPGVGVTINDYEVYRRNDALPTMTTGLGTQSLATAESHPVGIQLAGWTYVGSFPAHGESEYNVVAPTLANTNDSTLYYTAYMVRAASSDPFTFYDSGVENGHSIDNLSPPAPSPFALAYLSSAAHLHWGESSAPDFATFRLYRGATSAFVPGPSNFVAATTDTGYVDVVPSGSYYKLSAVDVNGNEGPFALAAPSPPTGVPPRVGDVFALEPMRPNPSQGPGLKVTFSLPTDAPAVLELIDVAGRRIAVRSVGGLGAGRHQVDLASGRRLAPEVYEVRLEQNGRARVERVAVIQ
jgi:DNA-binding beta-propeller fold protein YncE